MKSPGATGSAAPFAKAPATDRHCSSPTPMLAFSGLSAGAAPIGRALNPTGVGVDRWTGFIACHALIKKHH
jgi:hypothetical protein